MDDVERQIKEALANLKIEADALHLQYGKPAKPDIKPIEPERRSIFNLRNIGLALFWLWVPALFLIFSPSASQPTTAAIAPEPRPVPKCSCPAAKPKPRMTKKKRYRPRKRVVRRPPPPRNWVEELFYPIRPR